MAEIRIRANMRTFIILVYFCTISGCAAQDSFYSEALQRSFETLDQYRTMNLEHEARADRTKAFKLLKSMSKLLERESLTDSSLASLVSPMVRADQDIANCTADIFMMITAASGSQMWAAQMIDAIGKPEADILGGKTTWVGSYDECRRVKPVIYGANGTTSYTPFTPQYCTVTIYPDPPIKLPALGIQAFGATSGFCLPDSCSDQNARDALNLVFSLLPKIGNRRFWAINAQCHKDPEFDSVALTAIIVLGILAFFTLLGTALDVYLIFFPLVNPVNECKDVLPASLPHTEKSPLIVDEEKKPREPGIVQRLLLSFSVYTNGRKLLSTAQSSESLTALNGVRFLSISWVVLGHTYAFIFNSVGNLKIVSQEMVTRWTFQAIGNALVSVDSFFALSGLLLAYLTLKELERKGGAKKFNWAMFYFHRFWRLTPPYMLILMAEVGLFRYVGDGPGWPAEGAESDQCKDSWWWNLLYINNFQVKENVAGCFGHAWYLANDMQFFILSPIMLIPLFYHGILGVCICMAFITGTWIATGVISTHYDLPPTSLFARKNGGDYMKYYYIKPWCRIGPYVVGILTGYLLYKFKGRVRINKFLNLFIWAVMATLALVILYGLHDYFNGEEIDKEVAALFNATHRTLWGVVVCWVIFACATGHGGFVNDLLSWKAFAPLARLSYCVYLVHPFIIYSFYYSQRQYIYLTDYEGIYLFLGHLVVSNMVAFVSSLMLEAPMLGLEKVIFKRGRS